MLCKNICLTADLIDKLQQAAQSHGGIFIEESYYEEVWNESLRRYSQKTDQVINTQYELMIEYAQPVFEKYDAIATSVLALLDDVLCNNEVSLVQSDSIAQDISHDLCTTEDSLILNCINQIRAADDYLYLHSTNVATLNGLIGKWMELPDAQITQLVKIGLLHDVGKLYVPPDILNKPGRLTPQEFQAIQQHPIYSFEVIRDSGETDETILTAVRGHHEKSNGTGYPDGLLAEDIPLFSAITAVSDIYDAMVSKRCYKDANTPFEVLEQFYQNQFSNLDSRIVAVFLKYISYMLIGKTVRLSTQESGEVVYVNPSCYAYPIVRIDNRIIITDDNCRCVAIED